INVVERFGFLIFSILAWIFTFSLETLISCFAGVQLIKALLTYSLTKNYFTEIDLKWQPARLMSIFKQAYPFALMGLFGTVSMRIDTIMLKIFHTDAIVGIYNVARKLMESITFIPENISYALFPALSVLYLTQKRQFDRTFQRTFHYLMFVAILIVIVLFILSPQIINLLFEPEFARAYIPLRWLSLALGILFMKFAFTALMSAIGKQHLLSILAGIGMLINVGLNYLLIPDYDILGASLASVVSEAIIIITIIIVIRKTINLPELALPIFKALLAGLVLAVIVYLIQSWNIFLVLILAGLFYLSLLAALKVVSKEDVQYFYQFFQKRLFS
ncbi:oligosaccharide flippase family protein, partial [Candidatus Saccharibacteria bacterium]|nr:oligosaccharide flippase family protein [Candidatus Saccharibacteria bacterium]NIV72756.1 oligosaccharide flippase family protein [Calditrichia bacterium]NIV99928.1 oligosaccharide flippase family protein [Candidatus Saccharibacteria bacterium]NIW80304.1 oligosaccharide flippase family protein [Calditrichia bacterium]